MKPGALNWLFRFLSEKRHQEMEGSIEKLAMHGDWFKFFPYLPNGAA
jgi:hypothetical protein